MSLSTARRIALLSLFLFASVIAVTSPASAVLVRLPETGPAAPAPAPQAPATAVSQAPDVTLWILVGIAVLSAAAGLALAVRRYRHTRRAAVSA